MKTQLVTILKTYKGGKLPNEIKESLEDLNNYHKPTEKDLVAFEAIRKACLECMITILENCPSSNDRFMALNLMREVRMKANSSIALKGQF